MITRRSSRIIIGTAALSFIMVLLFSGPITSAAKGDRSAPTAPTNLVVTAIPETTATLTWSGSTDNSGKFSYKLRIINLNSAAYNSLATISQTQTTYTVRYLAPNSPHTFSVYAVDGNGNKSGDSNLVSASTLPDTTAPSTPVVQAVVHGPSQVQLTWAKSTDNINYCCSYSINMNGSPFTGNFYWLTTRPETLSVLIRHLPPGSTNTFSVTVRDWAGGNVATSAGVTMTTEPSNDVIPPTAPTSLHLVRHYGCGEVDLAWTESLDETDDVIEYEVYVNGVLSPLRAGTADFAFVYGTGMGDNIFTVKAVDRSGNTSAASSPLRLVLWPC